MLSVEEFISCAKNIFKLNEEGRGARNKNYIPIPAKKSLTWLPAQGEGGNFSYLTNPFIFITDRWYPSAIPYSGQNAAKSPSILLLIGQYGLGKTELVHQLCAYLESAPHHRNPIAPLPINLALCRNEVKQFNDDAHKKGNVNINRFIRLLFGRHLKVKKIDETFIETRILPDLHAGKILLLLDGLDELIADPRENIYFFSALSQLVTMNLKNSEGDSRAKVVVSMRSEYLLSVSPDKNAEDFNDIIQANSKSSSISCYFLELDFLDNDRIKSYFDKTLTDGKKSFEIIKKNSKLLEMLRRPLLLKIFCNLADKEGKKRFHLWLEKFKNKENPTELLREFVLFAQSDTTLIADQNKIAHYVWDADRLARRAVELYRAGKNELSLSDIKKILVSVDGKVSSEEIDKMDLTPTEILDGIHKCPFLWKDDSFDAEVVVRFAHKIFYEYFVARGIFIYKEQENYAPWINLVLNVDTRKFLKGMIPEHEWRERTKKSYEMEDRTLSTWEYRDKLDYNDLNAEREFFLDYMTDPANQEYYGELKDELVNRVNKFLKNEHKLHPRYLLYTYEAVCLYLWHNRWDRDGIKISSKFSDILHKRIEEITKKILNYSSEERAALELLAERIFDIAFRLRFSWVKKYCKNNDHLLEQLFTDYHLQQRARNTFNGVEKVLF